MDFAEVITRLNEEDAVIANLRTKGVDIFTITKIENALIRDTIIFIQTSYQEKVISAVLTKIKYHSNNNTEVINFVMARTKKVNIKIDGLRNILNNFSPAYAANFTRQLNNQSEINIYSSLLTDRINAAHEQGNNLQVGSLSEIRTAHEQAKQVLEKFESSMW